jgi:hypothetical protein
MASNPFDRKNFASGETNSGPRAKFRLLADSLKILKKRNPAVIMDGRGHAILSFHRRTNNNKGSVTGRFVKNRQIL